MAKTVVGFAENFRRNLDGIQSFLIEQDAEHVFADLVEAVFQRLIPAVEKHPRMGRDWKTRTPQSAKGKALRERVIAKLAGKGELREFILGDYLVLYALRDKAAVLLAIRHHRQLAYDAHLENGNRRSDRR